MIAVVSSTMGFREDVFFSLRSGEYVKTSFENNSRANLQQSFPGCRFFDNTRIKL